MYKLSDETKKAISDSVGIPYEKLIDMDDSEITAHIEQKTGKKLTFRPNPRLTGSGDDSVLIDMGKFSTMPEVDKRIDEIIKYYKSKKEKKHIKLKDKDDVSTK